MLALREYHYNALKCICEVMSKRIEELEAAEQQRQQAQGGEK